MPRLDTTHIIVRNALLKDGWLITDDPLIRSYGGRNVYIDLGASGTIGAERNGQKIAVEIKTFMNPSPVHDLENAVGQYNVYRDVLSVVEPDRDLYLAVNTETYRNVFAEEFGRLILDRQKLKILVFGDKQEEVLQWIN